MTTNSSNRLAEIRERAEKLNIEWQREYGTINDTVHGYAQINKDALWLLEQLATAQKLNEDMLPAAILAIKLMPYCSICTPHKKQPGACSCHWKEARNKAFASVKALTKEGE